jgi:hypothetical protein
MKALSSRCRSPLRNPGFFLDFWAHPIFAWVDDLFAPRSGTE